MSKAEGRGIDRGVEADVAELAIVVGLAYVIGEMSPSLGARLI